MWHAVAGAVAVLSVIIVVVLRAGHVWSHEEHRALLVTAHYYFWYAL